MANALLTVEDLKTYFFTRRGVAKAVDGVSFTVNRGETLGLVGESGCGKTMTCLSILRLVPEPAGKIVGGSIVFEGEDLVQKSYSEMRRFRGNKISMIPQDPMTSLDPAFTIGEQIAEAVKLHQKVKGRGVWDKVVESLRLVRIPDAQTRLRDYPHQFSGGMRQRVTGAIALSCRPSLLLADEPTTSLDVTVQAQYLRLLKQVQEETNVAMIFITHDLGIIARMCDRVAVMYAGRIVEQAEVSDLFRNPAHPYTIGLMRCIPRFQASADRLFSIEGQPPSLGSLPRGCSFAPRCQRTTERCFEEYPHQRAVGDGHTVHCWCF